MYGSIARMRALSGKRDQLVATYERHFRDIEHISGYVGHYLYCLERDTDEIAIAIVFDSKASYLANSMSPEQEGRYAEVRALLRRDPEWLDGEVESFLRF
jgi:heme-degrading monooxygenase HmoA